MGQLWTKRESSSTNTNPNHLNKLVLMSGQSMPKALNYPSGSMPPTKKPRTKGPFATGEYHWEQPNPWVRGQYVWKPVHGPRSYAGDIPGSYYVSSIDGEGEVIAKKDGQMMTSKLAIPLPSSLEQFLESPSDQSAMLKSKRETGAMLKQLELGRTYSVFYSVPIADVKHIVTESGKGIPVQSLGFLAGPANILIAAPAMAKLRERGYLTGNDYTPVLIPGFPVPQVEHEDGVNVTSLVLLGVFISMVIAALFFGLLGLAVKFHREKKWQNNKETNGKGNEMVSLDTWLNSLNKRGRSAQRKREKRRRELREQREQEVFDAV